MVYSCIQSLDWNFDTYIRFLCGVFSSTTRWWWWCCCCWYWWWLIWRERERPRKITVPANAHNGLNSHKHCLVFQYGSTNENDKYRRGIFFFESFLIYRVFVVVGCATVAATMCSFFIHLFYTLRMAIILWHGFQTETNCGTGISLFEKSAEYITESMYTLVSLGIEWIILLRNYWACVLALHIYNMAN